MQLTTVTALASLLVAASGQGWDPPRQCLPDDCIANNNWYNIRGLKVHEACVTMNTDIIHLSGQCKYWIDGVGNIFRGTCHQDGNTVGCI
ncbi:hypothetical protein PG984_003023 [Apiospora sp. TS-2023a]